MDEDVLWSSWFSDQSIESRNALLVHFEPFVRHLAKRVSGRLPASVDRDDLSGEGRFALISCIESFDPDLGVSFTSFAGTRIEGQMLDWLRSEDVLPLGVRRRVTHAAKVSERMMANGPTTHEAVTEGSGATPLEVSIAEFGLTALLSDIERSQKQATARPVESALVVLDWSGLHVYGTPARSIPIDLDQVEEFGPPTALPCTAPNGYRHPVYEQLKLSPDQDYEWHLARVFVMPPTVMPTKGRGMKTAIERIELRIIRKQQEIEELRKIKKSLENPVVSNDIAEIFAVDPLPEGEAKPRPPSRNIAKIWTFLESTKPQTVKQIAEATGLTNEQIRGSLKSSKFRTVPSSSGSKRITVVK